MAASLSTEDIGKLMSTSMKQTKRALRILFGPRGYQWRGTLVATSELGTAQGRPHIRRASQLAVRSMRIFLLDPGATRARIGPTQTTTSDGVFGGG
jgi:hypothetical protein